MEPIPRIKLTYEGVSLEKGCPFSFLGLEISLDSMLMIQFSTF